MTQANSTLAQRPSGGNKTVMDLLIAKKDSFEVIATKHLTAEKLLKCVGVAMARIPKLAQCTPMSLMQCVMTCSQLGLDPSGVLGSAYLIPYEDKKKGTVVCQLIIGYRGMIDLCRRSGDVQGIQAWLVYRSDKFEIRAGTQDAGITHVPNIEADRNDKDIIGAYGVAKLSDGVTQFEWMSRKEIDGIRGRSMADKFGKSPWQSDFGEMAKKTVIRRLCKSLPISTETAEQIDTATRNDASMAMIDIEAASEEVDEGTGEVTPKGGNAALESALGKGKAAKDADAAAVESQIDEATTQQAESKGKPKPLTEAQQADIEIRKAEVAKQLREAEAKKKEAAKPKHGTFDENGNIVEDEAVDPPHEDERPEEAEETPAESPLAGKPRQRRKAE